MSKMSRYSLDLHFQTNLWLQWTQTINLLSCWFIIVVGSSQFGIDLQRSISFLSVSQLREVGQASHEWPLDSALFLDHVLNRIKTLKEQDTLRHHSLHLAFREPYPTIPVSQRRQLHDNGTEISLTLSNMQRPKHLLHSPPHLLSHLNYHPKCSIHKKHRTRLNPRLLYALVLFSPSPSFFIPVSPSCVTPCEPDEQRFGGK